LAPLPTVKPEFISKALDKWAYENKLVLDFSRQGKPTDNTYIESLEDQHKRVLLSYLIQDYHNMDEVLNLLKIGEIYKNIAEKIG